MDALVQVRAVVFLPVGAYPSWYGCRGHKSCNRCPHSVTSVATSMTVIPAPMSSSALGVPLSLSRDAAPLSCALIPDHLAHRSCPGSTRALRVRSIPLLESHAPCYLSALSPSPPHCPPPILPSPSRVSSSTSPFPHPPFPVLPAL